MVLKCQNSLPFRSIIFIIQFLRLRFMVSRSFFHLCTLWCNLITWVIPPLLRAGTCADVCWICGCVKIFLSVAWERPPQHHHHKGHVCPQRCATFLAAIVLQRWPLTSVTNLLTFRFLQRDGGQRRRYTCWRRPGGRTQTQAASVSPPPTMATVWCRDGGWRRQQTKVDRKWRTRLMGLTLLRS